MDFTSSTTLIILVSIGVVALLLGGGGGYLIASKKRKSPAKEKHASQKADPLNTKLRKLYKLLADLTSTLSYERVLDKSLDGSSIALGITGKETEELISAVLFFADDGSVPPVLRVASGRGLTRPDMSKKIPGLKGIIGKTIESGAPQLTTVISQDPELTQFWAFRTCKAGYCIPLRVNLETFGVLLFAHPEELYFAAEQREILNVISRQAMIALQNARLFQEIKDEKDHIIKAEDEARTKLARDLHDGPTQAVAAIAMQANLAGKLLKKNPAAVENELRLIEDTARRTTKEIRHMLFTLRPLVLESEGLAAALNTMAEKMNETYNQNVIVETDENVIYDLEMNSQTVIFTIAEEAVNNVRKHAKAKHIWVRVQRARRDFAVLEIEDDGMGFDTKDVFDNYSQRGSLGMVNMKERATLARGIFHIESKPGKGTKIEVVIPLTDDAADRIRKFQ